ncbi:MAG TPA: hypothetical protein VFN10_13565, partial [Thermoanaerobaculia bacterium]|nr:hypothetical protein [Thermoanaerobaculia bacterium]
MNTAGRELHDVRDEIQHDLLQVIVTGENRTSSSSRLWSAAVAQTEPCRIISARHVTRRPANGKMMNERGLGNA